MAPHLTPWTADELKTLFRQGRRQFWEDQSEWECPACGYMSVRSYMHYSRRPRVISYIWCANCWRFTSWTDEGPPVPFTDPLTEVSREELRIEFINEQWNKGVLPQKFGRSLES